MPEHPRTCLHVPTARRILVHLGVANLIFNILILTTMQPRHYMSISPKAYQSFGYMVLGRQCLEFHLPSRHVT